MSARANQLIEGSADFAQLTVADLPEAWRCGVDAAAHCHAARQMGLRAEQVCPCVVVELPNLPWAWKYQRWSQDVSVPGALSTMVVSLTEFRGGHEQSSRDSVFECLASLISTGKPAPFFCRIYVPRFWLCAGGPAM